MLFLVKSRNLFQFLVYNFNILSEKIMQSYSLQFKTEQENIPKCTATITHPTKKLYERNKLTFLSS